MPDILGLRGIVRTLAIPNFGLYTAGHSVSLVGTWMQRIAVGWLAWQLTESTAWLGLLAFANLIPSVFIGPIAGVMADRVNRLRVVAASTGLSTIQATALFGLTLSGLMTIELLFSLVLFHGFVAAFNQPSSKALVASLVPRGDLPRAVAINSIIFNLARFVGPAIAGGLIVAGGVATAFAFNAASFLVFLIALSKIHLDPEESFLDRADGGSYLAQMLDAVRYIVGHPGIGPMLLLYLAVALCARPVVELLPGFAAQIFGRGAETLAMLTAAMGLGAVAAGLVLAGRVDSRGLALATLAATLGLAVSILAFISTDRLGLGLACMGLFGFCMVSTGVGTQTLVQLSVDRSMRGRVLGFHGIIFRGGTALGALVVGAVSEWAGLRGSFAGGAAVLIMALAWAARRRAAIAAALDPR